MKIRDRIKKLVRVQANELLPNPKNWRTHPKAQQDALRGILAEVGIADALLARELPDGSLMLIDGHLRAETAADAKVPVLILDVTEAEADKILVTLDPLAAMAGKDAEQLAALLGTLKEQDDTLAALVWPDYIMEPLLAADWTPPAIDDIPSAGGGHKIGFSADQWETVKTALAKCREDNDRGDELTDGQCVELICQNFLS